MKLIRIRFADQESNGRALGFLAGRFSFTSYDSGETIIAANALSALAVEGISYTVEGWANYLDTIPTLRHLAKRGAE